MPSNNRADPRDELTDRRCDVAVVGGGPAGSTIASMLSHAGWDTVVLEGKRFPREHIGESLLAISMPLLDELGLREALAAQKYPRKRGSLFVWGAQHREMNLAMTDPGYSWQVQRGRFDSILLNRAIDRGATVLQEHWARSAIRADDGRVSGVHVQPAGGSAFRLTARLVVDASGLFQYLPRQFGLPQRQFGPRRVGIGSYWRNAGRPRAPHGSDVVSEACADGWLWFIPLSDTLTSLGFVGDECDVSGDPQEILQAQIDSTHVVRGLVERAQLTRRARVLKYTNHQVLSPWWADGGVLVGDTAAFVDPLFSTGVHAALYSAMAAAAAAGSYLAGEISEESAAAWYDDRARTHYAKITEMIRLLYGLHPGDSRFWRSRRLDDISETEAERILSGMGVDGVDFFANPVADEALDFPSPVARRLAEFRCRPRPVHVADEVQLRLADDVRIDRGWMRSGTRLVPATMIGHRRGRTHRIECRAGGALDQLLRQVDGRQSLAELVARSARPDQRGRLRHVVGMLIDGGLLSRVRGEPDGHHQ
jgi:halogenation protein CepH